MAETGIDIRPLLRRVQQQVERHEAGGSPESGGVFDGCEIREGEGGDSEGQNRRSGPKLVCRARGSAAPASYRLEVEGGRLWVSLVMADRWMSGSIELDLIHSGDKLEELLEEELVELGYVPQTAGDPPVRFEHFRSADLLFTFRTPVPVKLEDVHTEAAAERAAVFLLAYEACFRHLGDMAGAEDEEA